MNVQDAQGPSAPSRSLEGALSLPRGEPRRARRTFEAVIEWALFACALLSIGTTIGIIAILTIETASFLRDVSITEFLL